MEDRPTYKERLRALKCIVVIPTYNNEGTIAKVISDVKEYAQDILVVNDGATDRTPEIIAGIPDIQVVGYGKNRGKGFALRTAIREAAAMGFDYMLTIDSDGQHYADDIPVFIDCIERNPGSLLIGARNLQADNMPSKNTFANKFSNFWFKVETGQELSDTQSGYRLYPLEKLKDVRFVTERYEFEVEVIVRAAWNGVKVQNVPIKVYYAPTKEERVSHFKPLKDFTRISILNTVLVLYAFLIYYPWRFLRNLTWKNICAFVDDNIIHSRESNARIAAAMGWGIFCGIIPIWGYQMVFAVFSSHFMKLNKVIALIFSNISIPPMIPFILYGSASLGALLLGKENVFDFNTITLESLGAGLGQYVLGSFVLAAAAGLLVFVVAFLLMHMFKRKVKND